MPGAPRARAPGQRRSTGNLPFARCGAAPPRRRGTPYQQTPGSTDAPRRRARTFASGSAGKTSTARAMAHPLRMADQDPSPDLSVVMPVYNEEAGIVGVVEAWSSALDRLGISYELRVYDDGSRDRTGELLDQVARGRASVVALHHENRGHGPTILRGYREARGDWVFQVDGDDEMGPEAFPSVWSRREEADLVLGFRTGRQSPPSRRLVTASSRLAVRALFGAALRDVNTPYRLYHRTALVRLLGVVPLDAFAPNVILAGLAVRGGLRVVEVPVPHRERRTGVSSIA